MGPHEFVFKCRPICRTVADAVHVLDAIVGYDELDAVATRAASKYIPEGGYTQFLKIDGLKGKRIGVPNGFFDFEDGNHPSDGVPAASQDTRVSWVS